jgi:hypothetical protein
MITTIIEGLYINIMADNGKMLTNGDVITKEIFAPLDTDVTMWVEINEENNN